NISGNTFFANGAASGNTAGLWLETPPATYTIENNIFAGVFGSDHGGIVYNAGTGAQTTLTNNHLALAGPYALAQGEFGAGAPAGTAADNIFVHPQFNSVTVSSLADLATAFDIQNPALEGAGTGGSDISGWGVINIPPTPTAA